MCALNIVKGMKLIMKIFSINHLILIFLLILFSVLIGLKFQKNKANLTNILLLLFFSEIAKCLFLIITDNFHINNNLPLQLCYLYPIIGIIYLKTKKEFLLNYLGAFGILFAVAAIFFTNPKILNFNTIYCYLYHFFLLISGTFITKNYKAKFSFKNILLMFIQIIIAFFSNNIIKNGANYIFLNTFLDPMHSSKYIDNVEMFNIKIFSSSVNELLIFLINNLGIKTYIFLFTIIIISFSSLALYIFSKK